MRALLLTIVLLAVLAPSAMAAWTRPVEGRVVGRFVVGADPFAAGQRRGVDLAAAPGGRVVAPCSGAVAFAGAVPRFGPGVSLRCGALTATVLGLAGGLPRAGDAVRRGEVIGRVGEGGRIRLGARVTRSRFGYRDPLRLLGDAPGARPPLVGPRGPARRSAPPGPRRPAPPPVAAPARAPTPGHSGPPTLAWFGLALIACALPSGALAWRLRRSRPAPARRTVIRSRLAGSRNDS
jgi:hypothetical protein